ncbi:hypothetical protein ABEB36_014781 [Hypothenemus hampei]|uniref:Uncharacterized protein n=1 Tax=Hypothenemus hampei TaxID=57062 RepID=A0ABD1E4Y7_HYPHA
MLNVLNTSASFEPRLLDNDRGGPASQPPPLPDLGVPTPPESEGSRGTLDRMERRKEWFLALGEPNSIGTRKGPEEPRRMIPKDQRKEPETARTPRDANSRTLQ